MTTRVRHLTGATIETAPPCCVSCLWWQESGWATPDKRTFVNDIEDQFGPWGKLYLDGDRLVGFLQYGPQNVFPRAGRMPAGPPTKDAVLLTCSLLLDPSSPWALQSLVLACIGEVRDRKLPAVEAFAYQYGEAEQIEERRERRHHTIFPFEFLADFGFQPIRTSGRVALMRLELRGIIPVEEKGLALRAALLRERLARRRAPAPI